MRWRSSTLRIIKGVSSASALLSITTSLFKARNFKENSSTSQRKVPWGILSVCYFAHTTPKHVFSDSHTCLPLCGTSVKLYISPFHLSRSNLLSIDSQLRLHSFPQNRCHVSITHIDVFNKIAMRKEKEVEEEEERMGFSWKINLEVGVLVCPTWQPFSQLLLLLMLLARNFF